MINCWLPYYHAEVLTDGTVKPCCKYQGNWVESLDRYNDASRTEFNTPVLPQECAACKVSANVFSYRKHRTIEFVRHGWNEPTAPLLKNLNLSIDNVCASSCLQCSPKQSTTIGQLLNQPTKLSWNLDLLDEYIPTIEYLTISGGEPLQSPNLIKLCDKLKGSNIKSISIPTGLSKIKMQNVDALLSLEIPIQLRVSIDAPWDLNEWIRGCNQTDWVNNFNAVKEKFSIAWQITVGAYNVFAIPECLDYIETLMPGKHIQPSPIVWPESHAVKQLPDCIKEQVKTKLSQYSSKFNNKEIVATSINLLEETQTLNWDDCISKIETIPKLRGDNRQLVDFIKRYL